MTHLAAALAGRPPGRLPTFLRLLPLLCVALLAVGCESALKEPVILQQPADQVAFETRTATFIVGVEGAFPLQFQWRRDGVDIAGATSGSYTTPALALADDGARFSVVISNSKGTVTSGEASLSIRPGPTIATQPASQTVALGATATFSATGSGEQLAYQWRRNDVDITGANAATYTTPATTLADDGAVYTVAVSNPGGTAVSDPAILTVSGEPAFSIGPASQVVAAGRPAIFSALAGGGDLVYQWRRGAADIAGANAPVYTLAGSALADDGASFAAVVSNTLGTATSAAATLTVVDLPNDPPPALVAEVAMSPSEAANATFVLVRRSDGSVWHWGYNGEGQRGNDTLTAATATPGRVTLPQGAVAIQVAAGGRHALALLANGDVYAWGVNLSGQLGLGDSTGRLTPTKVTLPAAAVAVAAGGAHSLAVLADGRVFAWGDNSSGQLGNAGRLPSAVPVALTGIADAVQVAAGRTHSLALLADGRVLAWGGNTSGQLGDGSFRLKRTPVDTGARAVARIRAGGNLSLAVTEERVLLAWGENSDGQLARGAAFTTDIPTPTGIATGVVDAAAAEQHLLVVTSDGRVLAAGRNGSGELGDGTSTARSTLTQATGVAGALTVAAGGRSSSLALRGDGRVFAWGDNAAQQFGNTSVAPAGSPTPTAVPNFDATP